MMTENQDNDKLWKVLVMELSSDEIVRWASEQPDDEERCQVVNAYLKRRREVLNRFKKQIREMKHNTMGNILTSASGNRPSEKCELTYWPSEEDLNNMDGPGHALWVSFWDKLKEHDAHVLVLVNDGNLAKERESSQGYLIPPRFYRNMSSEQEQKSNDEDNYPYKIDESILALEIANRFERGERLNVDANGSKEMVNFQVILLVGFGSTNLGELINEKFRSMPVLIPPSILCWDSRPRSGTGNSDFIAAEFLGEFQSLCEKGKTFLSNALDNRYVDIQFSLDLRGSMHTFLQLKRAQGCTDGQEPIDNDVDESFKKEASEKMKFYPDTQIHQIDNIYFRIGLCSYELCRRLRQIIDFGMLYRFAQGSTPDHHEYGHSSTAYLFAELFAWLQVLREQPAQLFHQPLFRELEWSFTAEGTDLMQLEKFKDEFESHGVETWEIAKGNFQLLKFRIRSIGERMVTREGLDFQITRYVDFLPKWRNLWNANAQADHSEQTQDPEQYTFNQAFECLRHEIHQLTKWENGLYKDRPNENESESNEPKKKPYLVGNSRRRLIWIHICLKRVASAFTPHLVQEEQISITIPEPCPIPTEKHDNPQHKPPSSVESSTKPNPLAAIAAVVLGVVTGYTLATV